MSRRFVRGTIASVAATAALALAAGPALADPDAPTTTSVAPTTAPTTPTTAAPTTAAPTTTTPSTTAPTTSPSSTTVPDVESDGPATAKPVSEDLLRAALEKLKTVGAETPALEAAKALADNPKAQISDEKTPGGTNSDAPQAPDVLKLIDAANVALKSLGIQPFINPSVSFGCVAPTPNNPFGIAPAVAGAAAGPWSVPGVQIPASTGFSSRIVDDGNVIYGFLPVGLDKDDKKGGMQVAWFNVTTLQGGLVPMASPADTLIDLWLKNVPKGPLRDFAAGILRPIADNLAPKGSRLAPVKTGKGTVLSLVFGNVENGSRNCFFLPMVGIVNVT